MRCANLLRCNLHHSETRGSASLATPNRAKWNDQAVNWQSLKLMTSVCNGRAAHISQWPNTYFMVQRRKNYQQFCSKRVAYSNNAHASLQGRYAPGPLRSWVRHCCASTMRSKDKPKSLPRQTQSWYLLRINDFSLPTDISLSPILARRKKPSSTLLPWRPGRQTAAQIVAQCCTVGTVRTRNACISVKTCDIMYDMSIYARYLSYCNILYV